MGKTVLVIDDLYYQTGDSLFDFTYILSDLPELNILEVVPYLSFLKLL